MASRRRLLGGAGPHLLRLAQRDVDGVVERGGPARRRRADRRLERGLVVGERLDDLDAAVEVHDLGQVLLADPLREAHGGVLRDEQPLLHAGARVDEERQRDWQVRLAEIQQVLLRAVLDDREIRLVEIRHVAMLRVGDGHAERHDVDAGLEDLRRLCGAGGAGLPWSADTSAPAPAAIRAPRTVSSQHVSVPSGRGPARPRWSRPPWLAWPRCAPGE